MRREKGQDKGVEWGGEITVQGVVSEEITVHL